MKKPNQKTFIKFFLLSLIIIGGLFILLPNYIFAADTDSYINTTWGDTGYKPDCKSLAPNLQQIDSSFCTSTPPSNPTGSLICCGSPNPATKTTPPKYTGAIVKPKTEFLAPIPGIKYGSIEKYLSSIYDWGIGIVGILALIQLVRGGFMYMISGAVEQKSSAKEIITDALIGLAIALASVAIVSVLNPRLAIITEPVMKTPAPENKTNQEEPLPIPTRETISRCLTYAELQNYIDNDYSCGNMSSLNDSCSSEYQGYFQCFPPSATSEQLYGQ